MRTIYSLPLWLVPVVIVVCLLVWAIMEHLAKRHPAWVTANMVVALAGIFMILSLSVIGREVQYDHELIFFSYYGREFWREIVMNVFLYFPFGMGLSVAIPGSTGRKVLVTLGAALLISLGIETAQYFTGIGVAQGTDLIANVAGAAIGCLVLPLSKIRSEK